jgi:hypothetical protein
MTVGLALWPEAEQTVGEDLALWASAQAEETVWVQRTVERIGGELALRAVRYWALI